MSEHALHRTYSLSPHLLVDIETRWGRAVNFYRKRGKVVFASYCRFWESHGFVQQSLATTLAEAGVEVVWLDGAGWRPYRPMVAAGPRGLTVRQLWLPPGRRIGPIDRLGVLLEVAALRHELKGPGQPLFWVQGGLDNRAVKELSHVDVFSVFDDPYRHAAGDELCRKASVILTQNDLALKLLAPLGEKVRMCLPPVDVSPFAFDAIEGTPLPDDFPERVMGYVGSFFPESFDFDLWEKLVESRPDWGFLLAGRTSAEGEERVGNLGKFPNFVRFPWMPRRELAGVWRLFDVSLLPYRKLREQDGACAVKVLESTHFGTPCVATHTPKTEFLKGIYPTGEGAEDLSRLAEAAVAMGRDEIQAIYDRLAYEMHPKLHLARVAEWLC